MVRVPAGLERVRPDQGGCDGAQVSLPGGWDRAFHACGRVGGGYGAAWIAGINPFGSAWLVWSQVMFVIAGMIWLVILVPIQVRQARVAKGFANGGEIPDSYRRDSLNWIIWGLIGTVPLVAAVWLMVAKPY